jgi:hypothetical protein
MATEIKFVETNGTTIGFAEKGTEIIAVVNSETGEKMYCICCDELHNKEDLVRLPSGEYVCESCYESWG